MNIDFELDRLLQSRIAMLHAEADIPITLLDRALPLLQVPPSGTVAEDEWRQCIQQGDPLAMGLLILVIVATDFRHQGDLINSLLAFLIPNEFRLSDFDRGRLWHIKGFSAWRMEKALLHALIALNRSLSLLSGQTEQRALAYLGRVWNTFAQLMHYQGRYHEARFGFEVALGYRNKPHSAAEKAFTLGSLARVCMDFGDYQAAENYLRQDLEIIRGNAMKNHRVEVQLLSELAHCNLLLGNVGEAERAYLESESLAQKQTNEPGIIFAGLGLGRVELERRPKDITTAESRLIQVRNTIESASLPGGLKDELVALAHELDGDIHSARGDLQQAIDAYELTRNYLEHASTTTPTEIAQILYKLARVHLEVDDELNSAMILRTALNRIDATALDDQREIIENLLKERFPQLWVLHAAGRFIGHNQIDYFLEQTGQSGFRGTKQEMPVLFSDIRGFTALSEALEPDALIELLNDYLTRMTRCIEMYGGIVDKFIGDAVMAIFPANDGAISGCENGTMAAQMMYAELEYLNHELAQKGLTIAMGIGLHFGTLVSGLIGSPQKRSYTVIGDTVNTASRLEGMTKQLGARLLLSGSIVEQLPKDKYLLRPLGSYSPKGRKESVRVYDLMGENDGSLFSENLKHEIDQCRRFVSLLDQGEPEQALRILSDLANSIADETRCGGYRLIAQLIEQHGKESSDRDWGEGLVLRDK